MFNKYLWNGEVTNLPGFHKSLFRVSDLFWNNWIPNMLLPSIILRKAGLSLVAPIPPLSPPPPPTHMHTGPQLTSFLFFPSYTYRAPSALCGQLVPGYPATRPKPSWFTEGLRHQETPNTKWPIKERFQHQPRGWVLQGPIPEVTPEAWNICLEGRGGLGLLQGELQHSVLPCWDVTGLLATPP